MPGGLGKEQEIQEYKTSCTSGMPIMTYEIGGNYSKLYVGYFICK